jgi:hypothetical protein
MAICLTAEAALSSSPLRNARESDHTADLARAIRRNFPRGPVVAVRSPLTDLSA